MNKKMDDLQHAVDYMRHKLRQTFNYDEFILLEVGTRRLHEYKRDEVRKCLGENKKLVKSIMEHKWK